MADEEREALRRLQERLGQASETAQRLMAEAALAAQQRAAEQGGAAQQERHEEDPPKPPPSGWQASENGRATTAGAELDALIGAVRSLRELVPPEVVQRLAEAVKDVLLALRALIDWYIERLERRRTEPPPVEDIPIE
jgi:uncharacterized caspase-like protein